MNSEPKQTIVTREGRLLFVFMVIVGYITTFAFVAIEPSERVTDRDLFWGIALGVAYTLLGLNNRVILNRLPAG